VEDRNTHWAILGISFIDALAAENSRADYVHRETF
jgi:hypothetical protein